MSNAIRIKQPDGSFKIIFRESNNNENVNNNPMEIRENNKSKKQDTRYYNPLNPDHIDIFGKDLLNKDLIFSLINNETVKGKMTGFGQYEILIESGSKKLILLKQGIIKIEVL